MDNSTYDALNLSPCNSNETYSTLATIPIKVNQSYETQRQTNINKSKIKQNDLKGVPYTTKLIVVLIIMMVILLLITIVSIALSIATYSRLTSKQPNVPSPLDDTNDDIISVLHRFSSSIQSQLTDMLTQPACGPGLWWRVAYLNMTDPSQQCPPAWREYNTSGVRACGRPVTSEGSCPATSYFTGRQYSRVCGRVIGYQFASPDGFQRHGDRDIDLDGINITHGAQCKHIWSYVAGLTQDTSSQVKEKCPCSTDNGQGREPPSSIGDNYYCESGNPDENFMPNHLYANDPLWDGQQCEGTCCNGTNSPPWFSVQLSAPTTDTIQVSICCDQRTDDEDTPVELIEIYVQ